MNALALAPSRHLTDWPELRSIPESTLLHGSRHAAGAVVARSACACGTDVLQLAGDDVPAAVIRHNATTAHAAWSAETREI